MNEKFPRKQKATAGNDINNSSSTSEADSSDDEDEETNFQENPSNPSRIPTGVPHAHSFSNQGPNQAEIFQYLQMGTIAGSTRLTAYKNKVKKECINWF